ncbi:hypothetical protein D3C73_1518250 [compost metagenome]
MQVVDGDAGGGTQAHRQRRRDTRSVKLRHVALGHAVVVAHEVDAQGGAVRQFLIQVRGDAPVMIRA